MTQGGASGENGLPPALAALLAGAPGAPRLAVRVAPPDIRPWLAGNAMPGVWSFCATEAGPHVVIVGLMHGNEIGGAVLLDRWLRAGLRPRRGKLTLVFANLEAYARFDVEDPTASRFLDEDMNRLWDEETLDGGRRSAELRRARMLRPVFDTADVLLDLHSMLWPGDPLLLCGQSPPASALALQLGTPMLAVADEGHAGGRRLLDYAPFSAPGVQRRALLLEAGSHWEPETVAQMDASATRLLQLCALTEAARPAAPGRLAYVTRTVTAGSTSFTFLRPYRGGQVVAERNTLIALDGDTEIRTPHDDCLLVMPNLRVGRGQTAVRLARFT
jgi:succinylglutamate desuccinylase